LELIHSNLSGPFSALLGGASYYIVYINDVSQHCMIYFLSTKTSAEVMSKVEHFNVWVKAQGYHIKCFQYDNGIGEYANKTFWNALGKDSIDFEPSPLYTQHKNGVPQCMIQTINSKARAMLLDVALPVISSAKALNTACYLHQHSLSQSLNNYTPLKVLYGKPPPLQHR
jgi:hypothetical protein